MILALVAWENYKHDANLTTSAGEAVLVDATSLSSLTAIFHKIGVAHTVRELADDTPKTMYFCAFVSSKRRDSLEGCFDGPTPDLGRLLASSPPDNLASVICKDDGDGEEVAYRWSTKRKRWLKT